MESTDRSTFCVEVVAASLRAGSAAFEVGEAGVVDLADGEGEVRRRVHLKDELAVLPEVRRPGTDADRGEVVAVERVEGGVVLRHRQRDRPRPAAGPVDRDHLDGDLTGRRPLGRRDDDSGHRHDGGGDRVDHWTLSFLLGRSATAEKSV